MTPNELFEKYQYLVKNTAYAMFGDPVKFARKKNMDLDDILQYGKIGLWDSCNKYRESKGRQFKSYAINRIRWSISQGVEKDSKLFSFKGRRDNGKLTYEFKNAYDNRVGSLDDQLNTNDTESNVSTYHDVVGNGYNLEQEVIDNEYYTYIENNLSEQMLDIIKMKADGHPCEVMGKKYGVSRERVRQKIVQMRKHLANEHYWEGVSV
ncbi:sigma-70 family RNA polymerase sigma factor [Rossellomorea marisflavi]|uniref:sigma-70 family RNA polymerase sigma factor n=1 Tax=Rossellomorea marisflavi TaxID=189381 RepID=UPI003F9F8AF3